jgi:hypothetical protein
MSLHNGGLLGVLIGVWVRHCAVELESSSETVFEVDLRWKT